MGRRFGFVRFIRVKNTKEVEKRLCEIWFESYHVFASVARFNRKESNSDRQGYEEKQKEVRVCSHQDGMVNGRSYAKMVSREKSKNTEQKKEMRSLIIEKKELTGLTEVSSTILAEVCGKCTSNMGIQHLFTRFRSISSDFVVNGRLVWLEISKLPLCAWNSRVFKKIAAVWGDVLFADEDEPNSLAIGKGGSSHRNTKSTGDSSIPPGFGGRKFSPICSNGSRNSWYSKTKRDGKTQSLDSNIYLSKKRIIPDMDGTEDLSRYIELGRILGYDVTMVQNHLKELLVRNGETISAKDFNEFIDDMELIDVPMGAKKFNRMRSDQMMQHKMFDSRLGEIDRMIDDDHGSEDIMSERRDLLQKVMDLNDFAIKDNAQKTKIKWIKEGNENTKMYHGMLNRKKRQNNISGVVIDGEWVTDPKMVKDTFPEYYAMKFQSFSGIRPSNRNSRHKCLSDMHVEMIERTFRIKRFKMQCGRVDVIMLQDRDNVESLIRLLNIFYLASRLQLNIQKSKLYGIGVTDVNVQELARCTGCGADSLPFVYLGLPVGERMYRVNSWRHLVNKFQTRLAKWKSKLMSIGGRLTLAKSVIGSLRICYLSLFPLPAHVNKQLESIRARFFGGIDDNAKKSIVLRVEYYLAVIRINLDQYVWQWKFDDEESFTVRSVRNSLDVTRLPFTNTATRWCKIIPIKVNVFVWRVMLNRLPTRTNLDHRGIDMDSILFPSCNTVAENSNHMFFSCNVALELWNKIAVWLDLHILEFDNMDAMFQCIDGHDERLLEKMLISHSGDDVFDKGGETYNKDEDVDAEIRH
ncbi:RNA-directed DNA polymerase, eukaryota [Tanacetum coccineum]